MTDRILIADLELSSHIGVPAAERAAAQRLTVNLVLEPIRDFSALGDALENTVDYFRVCEEVKALSFARPRRLIETLAEEIASLLLARFAIRTVAVELRKYILPETAFVAVSLTRSREAHADGAA